MIVLTPISHHVFIDVYKYVPGLHVEKISRLVSKRVFKVKKYIYRINKFCINVNVNVCKIFIEKLFEKFAEINNFRSIYFIFCVKLMFKL